ncbi:MAG: 8-amino-7-oxononanoate synthase [Nitrospirota bacterium]
MQNFQYPRCLKTFERLSLTRAVIDGREVTLFCSNDYLGLAMHPAVISAAKDASENGFGAGSAPLISGHSRYHESLRKDIADFKSTPSSLLFGSGYVANTGIIPALAKKGDIIFSDRLNHASIVDGCRLSGAEVSIYEHNDHAGLRELLAEKAGYKKRLIVTESVFSMDGDIAPLPEIVRLAEEYKALLMVDEAHSTGVLGSTGRGIFEHFKLPAGADVIQMGTFGKALGSYGAFAAGNAEIIDLLINSARSFIFSTALPSPACATTSAALRVLQNEPERLARLHDNASMLREGLKKSGFKVTGGGTPIIPVIVGGADEAVKLSGALLDAGFYAPAIRPPTVPERECRIRFTVSSAHEPSEILALLGAVERL